MEMLRKFVFEEDGAAIVEEAILVGFFGFAFYMFWLKNMSMLVRSYNYIWLIVHRPKFP